jgi:uncharacterized protein YndB with AHSA1/START domain
VTDDADAVLTDDRGRPLLRFERVLVHTPERVWRALTEPGELAAWHPSPFELEPVVGGAVSYGRADDGEAMPDGEITEYDPPRALAYSWGEDLLRFELHPRDGGCLLVLTHAFDDRFKAARDAAGWHLCLAALSASLDGEDAQGGSDAEGLPLGWQGLNRQYERRFRIPAEKATPPPER